MCRCSRFVAEEEARSDSTRVGPGSAQRGRDDSATPDVHLFQVLCRYLGSAAGGKARGAEAGVCAGLLQRAEDCSERSDVFLVQVVCRGLGFAAGGEARRFGSMMGAGSIWLSNVRCDGTEADIGDCRKTCGASSGCTHERDVGVCCWGRRQEVCACMCVNMCLFQRERQTEMETEDTARRLEAPPLFACIGVMSGSSALALC